MNVDSGKKTTRQLTRLKFKKVREIEKKRESLNTYKLFVEPYTVRNQHRH